MSSLRLVLVNARYWPLTGETEQFVVDTADGLRQMAVSPTVLTARWAPEWPPEMVLRETRAVRLPHAPFGGWSTYRYMRSLSRWLREHRRDIDLVYVMNLRHEAYAALTALDGARVGVVLRVRPDDFRWLETALRGSRFRKRAAHADAIVAPNQMLLDESLRHGFSRDKVHMIPNGASVAEPPSAQSRFQARCALAAVNFSLGLAEYAPLVVTAGPLRDGRNLVELVDSWRYIAARWPSAKLWILGDGPLRETLYERIVDRGLQHQIVLPGSFDDLSDVLHAADIYVAPAPSMDGSQHVLQAMSAGLPTVAIDAPEFRELLKAGEAGRLVPAFDRRAAAETIAELLETPRLSAQLGQAARRLVESAFPAGATWRAHRELFEQVMASKRRGTA
jgi:glycosyltransferase involved in cell wall biosynthesis